MPVGPDTYELRVNGAGTTLVEDVGTNPLAENSLGKGPINPAKQPFPRKFSWVCTNSCFLWFAKCKSGGTFGVCCGTGVLFPETRTGTKFIDEQFWGRAARAFMTRESRNARYFFLLVWALCSSIWVPSRRPRYRTISQNLTRRTDAAPWTQARPSNRES